MLPDAPRPIAAAPPPASPATLAAVTPLPRALLIALALLSALSLLPIILSRYPPLPDLSQHLAAASVIHNLSDPRYDLARYYHLRLGLNPYWGYYAPVHLLAYLFGVETASRVFLALYVCALPFGTALLARALGRSPWLSLFSFPVVWNYNFAIGFISFCAGLALLPFALTAFCGYCARPTWWRGIAAALLGISMYFTHLLPWGAWLGCAGMIGLLSQGRSLRRIAGRLCVWLPSLLSGAAITKYGRGYNMGTVSHGLQWKRYPTMQSLQELPGWAWSLQVDHRDVALLAVLLISWLALRLTTRAWPRTLHDLRAEACFVVPLAAYFILPRSITAPAYWWGVNIRFACIAALFFTLLIPGEINLTRGLRRFLLIIPALIALGFSLDVTSQWQRAARFCAGYDQLARLPEPGSRVLFVLGYPWHDPKDRFNYVHTYYGIYQTQHGGYMPWNFDEEFPLAYKVRYPSGSWREQRFDWKLDAPYYDYVFAFNHTGPELFGGHFPEVKSVGQSGRWSLWKLPGPRRDDSPLRPYPNPFL